MKIMGAETVVTFAKGYALRDPDTGRWHLVGYDARKSFRHLWDVRSYVRRLTRYRRQHGQEV